MLVESNKKINKSNANSASQHNLFNKKLDDYTLIKEIGKGAYSVVKLALHKPSKKKVAIKFYDKKVLLDDQKNFAAQRETSILEQISHPNIVRMLEVIETAKYVI